jgi:hypothetical protein
MCWADISGLICAVLVLSFFAVIGALSDAGPLGIFLAMDRGSLAKILFVFILPVWLFLRFMNFLGFR